MVDASRGLGEATASVSSSPRGLSSFGPRDAVSVTEATCSPPTAVHCKSDHRRSSLVDMTHIRIIGGPYLIHMDGSWVTVFGRIGCIPSALRQEGTSGHKCPLTWAVRDVHRG